MIKAIIWDMGSVLVDDGWKIVYKMIAQKCKMSEDKFLNISQPLLRKWGLGKINEKEFWKEFEKRAKIKLDQAYIKNIWFQTYLDYTKDIKESWKILAKLKLKNRNIRFAMITNTVSAHAKANEKSGRIKRLKNLGFEFIIQSFKVGIRKPSPKIYRIALKKLNLPAQSCLFIDDSLDNVEAAKKLGMQIIHFSTTKNLKKELIRFDLL